MANTTNYNWETPDDTDLVKDGAAAIRTLGSSIDTTTKALNPSTTLGDIEYRSATANTNTRLAIGTTGQVLSVVGGVPAWATSDDANAIQNALLTTTGDTIYASGASTPARLGIGSTGQVLTVAGGVPSWATPAGGATFSGVSLKKSAAQTVSNATDTAVSFDQENFDTDSYHDNSTNNSRITIPTGKDGYYSVQAMLTFVANSSGVRAATLRKNGSTNPIDFGCNNDGASSGSALILQKTVSAVAGDYFELYCYKDGSGTLDLRSGDGFSYFTMSYLGA
jgi:hypothetical protein